MELDWLETFLAVVDRGGFTAASSQVHRSQSRVSAHIASLEREIGIRLIDRAHRPAGVTEAGRVFAGHAREILADVRTARSAMAAVQAMANQSFVVHTTAWIGRTLFPSVLADVLARFPEASVTLAERDRSGDEPGSHLDRAVLAVLPADTEPHPTARRQILWWEPLLLLVPDDHAWAREGSPVRPDRLAGHRLVVCTTTGRAVGPRVDAVAGRTGPARSRLTVDAPQTLAALVRAGLGIGVINTTAAAMVDLVGLTTLPFDAPGGTPPLGFDVAVEWFDVLLTSPVGSALHEAVLASRAPDGAVDRRPPR